jgi:hypothetical protein
MVSLLLSSDISASESIILPLRSISICSHIQFSLFFSGGEFSPIYIMGGPPNDCIHFALFDQQTKTTKARPVAPTLDKTITSMLDLSAGVVVNCNPVVNCSLYSTHLLHPFSCHYLKISMKPEYPQNRSPGKRSDSGFTAFFSPFCRDSLHVGYSKFTDRRYTSKVTANDR